MKKKIIGLLFVVSLVCGMHSKVHADQINDSIQGQVQVVREKLSGTEGLYAVEISDEEAEQIAKDRALEDINWNNCECDVDNQIVYCCYKEGTEDE